MAKPENTFIASLNRHLPPLSELHREKMANPYRGGTADMWYSGPVRDLWIEWKFVPKIPTRASVDLMKDYLSPLQAQWIETQVKFGRNVWVGVGCKDGGFVLEKFEWKRFITPDEFRNRLLSRADLARYIAQFVTGHT